MSIENNDMAFKPEHAVNYVRLPDLFMIREQGTPGKDGKRHQVGAHLLKHETLGNVVKLYENGKMVGTMTLEVGFSVATKIVRGVVSSLIHAREHTRRNLHNRRVRKLLQGGGDIVVGNPPFTTPSAIAREIDRLMEDENDGE